MGMTRLSHRRCGDIEIRDQRVQGIRPTAVYTVHTCITLWSRYRLRRLWGFQKHGGLGFGEICLKFKKAGQKSKKSCLQGRSAAAQAAGCCSFGSKVSSWYTPEQGQATPTSRPVYPAGRKDGKQHGATATKVPRTSPTARAESAVRYSK